MEQLMERDENLLFIHRRGTSPIERAPAQARTVVERRAQEAGKRNGYTNPQIRIGERTRGQLARLDADLSKAGE